jgi:hypothetical protein
MERLMHVPNEMNHEARRLITLPPAQARIERARCVVGERRDNAALLLAVALELDAAVGRRIVLGVDEVEDAGEVAPARVPDRVRPRRNLGEIVIMRVAEEILEEGLRRVGDKMAREVGRGDVPEAWES